MIFKKRDAAYYSKKRNKIRAQMREIRKVKSETAKYLTDPKYRKLEAKFEKLGHKWWRLHTNNATFFGGPWGLDVTYMDVSLHDIRLSNWASTPEEKAERKAQTTPGTPQYNSLRVLEDRSKLVTFFHTNVTRTSDGTEYPVTIILYNGEPRWPTWATEKQLEKMKKEFEESNK